MRAASDVWSLGVVMHEMLSGTRPFTATSDVALFKKIMTDRAAPIASGRDDIPGLRRALRACLDEETTWLTVRMGPGPGLESYRADPEIDGLLNELYDGADPGGS